MALVSLPHCQPFGFSTLDYGPTISKPYFIPRPITLIPTIIAPIPTSPSVPSSPKHVQNEKKVPRGVIIRWKRPLPGFLKLNTDGSSRGNPSPSSYGGLVRDRNGGWVCGYMGYVGNNVTSLVAEIRGIYEGFRLIQRKGLRDVIVETDCMAALSLIVVGQKNHPDKILIEYCRLVMKECNCFITHTYREGNHCADQIAKLGGWIREENVELEQPPRFIMPYLIADASGVGYERPPK